MRTAQERYEAYQVIDRDYYSDGTDAGLTKMAEDARGLLAEPYNPADLMELIIDASNDPEAGGSPEYTGAHAIDRGIRGKGARVVHSVVGGMHKLVVNGVDGDWFPVGVPARNSSYCVVFREDGSPELLRWFNADLADFQSRKT